MRELGVVLVITLLSSCADNKRTQEPKEPLPYQSTEVKFKSSEGDVTLAGTLTTPTSDSTKTAVILISGSGPDNRDYKNQFGHSPFLVLAHYLTQKDIAVLRYDERGVGQSEGNYRDATYENLVSDVIGGINYLKANGFERIGLIGHSEGGGVAPTVSLQEETDFLVLMAPANDKADNTLVYQTGLRLKEMGVNQHTSDELIETLKSLLAIAKSETDVAQAKAKMQDIIARKNQSASEDYKTTSQRLGDVNRLIDGFVDPKFVYSLHHDPKNTFKKVRVPVLVLYGDDDRLLDVQANLSQIKTAFDSTEYEIKMFPGLGHLFMEPPEKTIAPEVMTTIGDWISNNSPESNK